uniref:Uncharacterized protein n=1 Tax=Heterorhabditis bacteriophora TaxID=37862 RepID=A0A1I7W754_HETBA
MLSGYVAHMNNQTMPTLFRIKCDILSFRMESTISREHRSIEIMLKNLKAAK